MKQATPKKASVGDVASFQRHAQDTGSTEVQIANITARILSLSKHLEQFQKDRSSRRGLLGLVNQRKSLLKYLESQDRERHVSVMTALGIRRSAGNS